MQPVLAELIGPDILIVLAVLALLFGGSKLPKLARSLGSAKNEFEKGIREGAKDDDDEKPAKADAKDDSAPAETKVIETKAIESTSKAADGASKFADGKPADPA